MMRERRERDELEEEEDDEPIEIALVGELGEGQAELHEKLLSVPADGECTIYINSPGGDPYCALSLMTVMHHRRLKCTAVVTGECSSAALWPLAACQTRYASQFSVFLFHAARWESAENIGYQEARQWASHFERLARESEALLARLLGLPEQLVEDWTREGTYVTGPELAERGCLTLLDGP